MENWNFKMFRPVLFEIRLKLHCHQPKIKPFLNRGITTKCLPSRGPGQNILEFWFSIWFFIPKKEFYSISLGNFFLNQLCFGTGVNSKLSCSNFTQPFGLLRRGWPLRSIGDFNAKLLIATIHMYLELLDQGQKIIVSKVM